MGTPVLNSMEDRPEPAPNIENIGNNPKFSFWIKKKDQLKELTMEMLNKTKDINKKKQLIGERLYHRVKDAGHNRASKLTGHILSLEVDVLFKLLSDDELLARNIALAQKRIDEINQKQQQIVSNVQNELDLMRGNLNSDIGNINSQKSGEKHQSPILGTNDS